MVTKSFRNKMFVDGRTVGKFIVVYQMARTSLGINKQPCLAELGYKRGFNFVPNRSWNAPLKRCNRKM